MFQLVYISSALRTVTADDVSAILAVSRRNNARNGLTGLLIHDGVRFLQALEGERDAVEARIEVIRADPRHRALVVLSQREIAAREFGSWAMADRAVQRVMGDLTLADTVDALVADVPDANTRELFRGFARIERKAA
jgi:hypothetical protein